MKGQWDLSELLLNIVTVGYTILTIAAIVFTLIELKLVFEINELNREAQNIAYLFISSKCAARENNGIISMGILDKNKLENLNIKNCFLLSEEMIINIKIYDRIYKYPENKNCDFNDKNSGIRVLPVLIIDGNQIITSKLEICLKR